MLYHKKYINPEDWNVPLRPCRICVSFTEDELSPTMSFRMSKLSKKQQKMLTRSASMKKPACVMSPKKTVAKIVGGDNYSEAEFSRVKRSLRRVNKVGRMLPSQSHIIPLAMQKKLDSPGLETLLQAMAFYRQARMSQVGCDPKKIGQVSDDNAWLKIWIKKIACRRAPTKVRNEVV